MINVELIWAIPMDVRCLTLEIQKSIHTMRICPQRVKNIRGMIVELDKQIEEV